MRRRDAPEDDGGDVPGAAAPTPDDADVATARTLFYAGLALLPWLHVVLLWHFRARLRDATAPRALRRYLCGSAISAAAWTLLLAAWVAAAQAARAGGAAGGALAPGGALWVYTPPAAWW
jgi:hypothetical protein